MHWARIAAGIVLAVAITGVSRGEMLVNGYQASVNDRFYVGADKAFLGDPYDFSGVGSTRNTNGVGTGPWATLVSASYVLSSTHDHPGVGSTVTFYENNDPNGPSHTYTVLSGQQVAGTDLFLERLTAPVPASDNIHPFAVVADNVPALTGAKIEVYGVPNRLGLNNIDRFATFDNVVGSSATGEALTYDYDTSHGYNPGEAMLQGGDSGGPSFVVVGGELALVGIHWFNYTGDVDPNRAPNGSGDTYVSRYINQINALMTGGEQLTVVAVPEPSTILLLVIGLPAAGLFLRRRA